MEDSVITRILEYKIDYGNRYEIQTNRIFEDGSETGYQYGLSLYKLEEVEQLRDALTTLLDMNDYSGEI